MSNPHEAWKVKKRRAIRDGLRDARAELSGLKYSLRRQGMPAQEAKRRAASLMRKTIVRTLRAEGRI